MDSILINTPVSSPLHVQLNLPVLKSYLASHGFSSMVLDLNIHFFREFLGADCKQINWNDCEENPLQLLSYYNEIEQVLWQRSKSFEELSVGLRSLSMKYDRIYFDSVLEALEDREANPFIEYYERVLNERVIPHSPKIVGIAITFQDQIIPAFTLAAVLRRLDPNIVIVLGGQIVTRCHTSIIEHDEICGLFDYMALWDGEVPLLDIHRKVIRGETLDFRNVVPVDGSPHKIERRQAAIKGDKLPSPDFLDINFQDYLFPEILVPLQTTRGCYARCSFCAIPYGSNRYRVRGAISIADEIERIQELTLERYGRKATYFKFMEDTSAPSTLVHFADEIRKRNIDAKWETFARLEKAFAEDGLLQRLSEGGCRKIHWGLETNDPDILSRMNKKTPLSYTDEILRLAGEAGILNFCFLLIGFPGETEQARQRLVDYVVHNLHIHTLTVSSFDLTRNSPIEIDLMSDNEFGLERGRAEDFQVRLPYLINGENWKEKIVFAAHEVVTEIVRRRPDIGFVTLFPDQIRSMFCEKYGNDWGRKFVRQYGEENVSDMLLNIEKYVADYRDNRTIDVSSLPEPLKREHVRTKEDMALLAQAVLRRKEYENRRIEQL